MTTSFTCACDNHLTSVDPAEHVGPRCRRVMRMVAGSVYGGNGLGGRGDDIPEVMERVAQMYNMG